MVTLSGSSRLHGILELQYGAGLIGIDDMPSGLLDSIKSRGRDAVGEAIKSTQRLQLMLDRSDGRPDLTPDLLAEKYSAFLSTCLRTPGGAWTATIGPMDYVGVKLKQHISHISIRAPGTTGADTECRVIDLKTLLAQMSSCLIDLRDESPVPAALQEEDAHRKILDLSLAVVRVATRYAMLSDQLDGSPEPAAFGLRLLTRGDVGSYLMLPVDALKRTMQLDLSFPEPAVTMDGTALEIRAPDVLKWMRDNSL